MCFGHKFNFSDALTSMQKTAEVNKYGDFLVLCRIAFYTKKKNSAQNQPFFVLFLCRADCRDQSI